MSGQFIPQVNLIKDIGNTKLSVHEQPMRMNSVNDAASPVSFGEMLTGAVKDLDKTVKAPDQLLQSSITGNGTDIHDVMIAMTKAELGVNMATQLTTKVIQAYDKVAAIQI